VNLACKASSLTIVTRYQRACLCITTTRSNFRRGARGSLVAGMLYTLILCRVMSYHLKLSSDFLYFVNQRRQEYFSTNKKI